jgi:hypothetical protein
MSRSSSTIRIARGWLAVTRPLPFLRGRDPLGPALGTQAEQLQRVPEHLEAPLVRGAFLQPLELVVAELEDLPAGHAHHVVVMLVTERVLEAAAAIAVSRPETKPASSSIISVR